MEAIEGFGDARIEREFRADGLTVPSFFRLMYVDKQSVTGGQSPPVAGLTEFLQTEVFNVTQLEQSKFA